MNSGLRFCLFGQDLNEKCEILEISKICRRQQSVARKCCCTDWKNFPSFKTFSILIIAWVISILTKDGKSPVSRPLDDLCIDNLGFVMKKETQICCSLSNQRKRFKSIKTNCCCYVTWAKRDKNRLHFSSSVNQSWSYKM